MLLSFISDIRTWRGELARGAVRELGRDGFSRNSFKKSAIPDGWRRFKVELKNVGATKLLSVRVCCWRSDFRQQRLIGMPLPQRWKFSGGRVDSDSAYSRP